MKNIYEVRRYSEELSARTLDYMAKHSSSVEELSREIYDAVIRQESRSGLSVIEEMFDSFAAAEKCFDYWKSSISEKKSGNKGDYHIVELYEVNLIKGEEAEDDDLEFYSRENVTIAPWNWTLEKLYNKYH